MIENVLPQSEQQLILLVDDSQVNLDLLTEILTSHGYRVCTATNGNQALELVAADVPDLILLDIRMPGMDGYEVCRRLKSDEQMRMIPVIFISALDDATEKVKGLKLGAVDYITSSFRGAEVLARVETHLTLRGLQKQLEEQNVQLQQEIIERRQAELQLRHAHGEIAQLFASIPSIMIGITPTGQVLHWNKAAERILGIAANDALGYPIAEFPIQWEWDKISEALLICREKEEPITIDEIHIRFLNGKDGFLRITVSSIKGEADSLAGLIILGSDITEHLILEDQLLQVQKLKSIGELAAGIAHEINTPSQYVGDNIRFLIEASHDIINHLDQYEKLPDLKKSGTSVDDFIQNMKNSAEEIDLEFLKEETPKALQQSLDGIERVSKIIRAMKEFSHPGATEKTAIDINRAIESTITVSRNEWKYVAEVITDLDPALPLVHCVPDDFNQVILNIIINAAHTIADVMKDNPDEKGIVMVKTKKLAEHVEIRISDTGGGIPEEIRSRIFDPFFTTKEVGRGTGQGLAISSSIIVEKHGGTISFETLVGKGSTFVINLPIVITP